MTHTALSWYNPAMSLPSEAARFRADYCPVNPETIASGLDQILPLLPPEMVGFLGELSGIESIDISDYRSTAFLTAEWGLGGQTLGYSDGFLAEITRKDGSLLLVVVRANDHETGPLTTCSLKIDGSWIEIMNPDLTSERFERSVNNLLTLRESLENMLGYRVGGEIFSYPG